MDDTPGRLAYVLQSFPERSQTFVTNELRELRRRGLVPGVHVLEPAGDPDPGGGDVPYELVPRPHARAVAAALRHVAVRNPGGLLRAVAFVLARPSPNRWGALGRALALVGALDQWPDRIHVHFLWHAARIGLLAALLVGARFSVTAHGRDLFVPNADAGALLARADPPVTVCEYNQRFLQRRWPQVPTPAVVPCGVDPETFQRTQPYGGSSTVVAVARLVEKKGLDDLVRAIAHLRETGHEVRCRIIGEGDQRAPLRALAVELDVGDLVELPGAVAPADVSDTLETAAVFCLPCVVAPDGDRDSQPVAVKEAMAMEVPVVATAEVGLPEVVDDRVGRLVPPRSPVALAAALCALLEADTDTRRAIGAAGRTRIEERFTITAGVDALLAAWDQADVPR